MAATKKRLPALATLALLAAMVTASVAFQVAVPQLTEANVRRIKVRMTVEEVEAILGQERIKGTPQNVVTVRSLAATNNRRSLAGGRRLGYWLDDGAMVIVHFNVLGEVHEVRARSIQPPRRHWLQPCYDWEWRLRPKD